MIRPIRNRKDYRAAMKRIDALWGAKKGTRNGELLEIWAILVDAYERSAYARDVARRRKWKRK